MPRKVNDKRRKSCCRCSGSAGAAYSLICISRMLEILTEDRKVVRVWSPLWVEMRRSVVSICGKDADSVEVMSCWKSYGAQVTPIRGGGKDKLVGSARLLYGIL